MRWYKTDSGFQRDDKILQCKNELGLSGLWLWQCILSNLAESYEGDPQKELAVSKAVLVRDSFVKPYKLISKVFSLALIFNFKVVENGNKLIFSYPKFLQKQAKYFWSDGRFKSSLPDNKKKEEDIEEDVGKKKPTPSPNDSEWIKILKAKDCYKGIDIEKELEKCLLHFDVKKIKVSRARFLAWLNRIDKPLSIKPEPLPVPDRKLPPIIEAREKRKEVPLTTEQKIELAKNLQRLGIVSIGKEIK